jgi:ubiquinone biosynthesis protein
MDGSAGPAARPPSALRSPNAERRTTPDVGVAGDVGKAATLRSARRLTRILRVLARHGFVGAVRGKRHWPSPAQAREALEELGVVFLKFGQVLALRRDFLPPAYTDELERLHDRLPPMPDGEVRTTIESELGGTIETLFGTFEREPLAAATIAQVHVATLLDGRAVVVKVRRGGLSERIAEDTAALAYLAALAEQLVPRLRALDLVGMVREFRESLRRETDLSREGLTIRRFRAALADVDSVWIPDVVPERTTRAVLTLEHSPGVRIDWYAEAHPEARTTLARQLATLVLHQVFETGLFHADPHPGNVFVLPDGRLCLHDFGMIGELDEPLREGLTRLLDAVVRGDARAATETYLELGLVGGDIDRPALETDLAALLRDVRERPLAEISVGDALASLLRVGSQHRVRNPGELLLLARAFLIAEAVMRRLDPELDVLEVFRGQVARLALQRYSPARLLRDGRQLSRDLERMAREAPADMRRALRRVADGDLGRVHAPELTALGQRMSRNLERLTGAVASAALVVAGAMLVMVDGWHRIAGDVLLAVGVLGTVATALGALRRPRS